MSPAASTPEAMNTLARLYPPAAVAALVSALVACQDGSGLWRTDLRGPADDSLNQAYVSEQDTGLDRCDRVPAYG